MGKSTPVVSGTLLMLFCELAFAQGQNFTPVGEIPELRTMEEARALRNCDPALATIGLDRVKDNHPDISGEGLAAVVIDSGVNLDHVVFRNREAFLPDPDGLNQVDGVGVVGDDFTVLDPSLKSVDDQLGHGTIVSSIIAARNADPMLPIYEGIAPSAKIIPLKVVTGTEKETAFVPVQSLSQALKWVLLHKDRTWEVQGKKYRIGVVNISLGFGRNWTSLQPARQDPDKENLETIRKSISTLTGHDIAVVVASGNRYFKFKQQGMDFPAIVSDALSVGAVFGVRVDHRPTGRVFADGSKVLLATRMSMTPFSQRMSREEGEPFGTVLFAPGDDIAVAHKKNMPTDVVSRTYALGTGTSVSAPIVAGSILLIQDLFVNSTTHQLTPVIDVKGYLTDSAKEFFDKKLTPEVDNVTHTNAKFRVLQLDVAIEKALEATQTGNSNAFNSPDIEVVAFRQGK